MSPGVALLLGLIKSEHSGTFLLPEEAISVAVSARPLTSLVEEKCLRISSTNDDAYATFQYVHVSDACRTPANDLVIEVNLENGTLDWAASGKAIESPEARAVAERLLAAHAQDAVRAKDEFDKVCLANGSLK